MGRNGKDGAAVKVAGYALIAVVAEARLVRRNPAPIRFGSFLELFDF
jgi:hypothetical protein